MIINFNIAKKFIEPLITINTDEKTSDMERLAKSIDRISDGWQIQGIQNGRKKQISMYQIIGFHTDGKKVICQTSEGEYRVNKRIYELKDALPDKLFIQISSSEIISIASIKDLELTKSGIYQINLNDGSETYTSRRYMKLLREKLLK
ncbi:LytTR family DNA-binding domain-containing protein [Companilactobacillus mishanensis]|nr:LytTR family DNA-binding domain-containing protein [Companilactobacillus mishanensis]